MLLRMILLVDARAVDEAGLVYAQHMRLFV